MQPISVVMPTVDWGATFEICAKRVLELLNVSDPDTTKDEFLVVVDGPEQPCPAWLLEAGATVLFTGERSGPARARNLGAGEARNSILLFVDADVELAHQSVNQIRQQFSADPKLAALFGSYDASPASAGMVSQFRNLLHHHTHQQHPGPARTFWAGCGAIKRDAFMACGGFNTHYQRPSIEDIELGNRLDRAGYAILLDPTIQCRHHKHWTLASMLRTDIQDRAIPWCQLILAEGTAPSTLNLSLRGRLSAGLALLVPLFAAMAVIPELQPWAASMGVTALLGLVGLNASFHRLHQQRCGPVAGLIGIGLHLLHLWCASGTMLVLTAHHLLQRKLTTPAGLQRRPELRRRLIWAALAILGTASMALLCKGLITGWIDGRDLKGRWEEWSAFAQGYLPLRSLYRHHAEIAAEAIPTSVYPAWAFPLFGLLFQPWGYQQGLICLQILSGLSLLWIAALGYRWLRPYGKAAAWLGAFAPLAIAGNGNALAVGQLSLVCCALIALEWQLLQGRQPLAAGCCWALAMIKPHLAILHGLALARPHNRIGAVVAGSALLSLAAASLWHTGITPANYLGHILRPLRYAQGLTGEANTQFSVGILLTRMDPLSLAVPALLVCAIGLGAWLGWRRLQQRLATEPGQHHAKRTTSRANTPSGWINTASLYSIASMLLIYHRFYDNIVLIFPLLSTLRTAHDHPQVGSVGLATLMALSLWLPQRVFDLHPSIGLLQNGIWALCGLAIAWDHIKPSTQSSNPEAHGNNFTA